MVKADFSIDCAQTNRLSNATWGEHLPVVMQRMDEQGRFARKCYKLAKTLMKSIQRAKINGVLNYNALTSYNTLSIELVRVSRANCDSVDKSMAPASGHNTCAQPRLSANTSKRFEIP